MYTLYLDSYMHPRLDVARRHMDTGRADIDLSQAMRKREEDEDKDLQGQLKA